MRTGWAGIASLLAVILGSGCSADAEEPTPRCGDGALDRAGSLYEQCDDGNLIAGDGCSPDCVTEAGWTCSGAGMCKTYCGDKFVTPDEVCDPSSAPPKGEPYCANDCQGYEGRCGDGILQKGLRYVNETCDTRDLPDPGCDNCNLVFGYLFVNSDTPTEQSGIDPNRPLANMTNDEQQKFCYWITSVLSTQASQGENGMEVQCDGWVYQIATVSECVSKLSQQNFGACLVGQFEEYVLSLRTACKVLGANKWC